MTLTYDHIAALALSHGFKLKPQPDGRMALNDYVIDFARAVYQAGHAAAKAETAAAGALSRDEWSRRYAARIAAVAGWDQASADAAAEAVPDEYMGDYASPEEAADDEMSNWEDDGDE